MLGSVFELEILLHWTWDDLNTMAASLRGRAEVVFGRQVSRDHWEQNYKVLHADILTT